MFIPYRDDNPSILKPYVTYVIIALNIVIFLFQLSLNPRAEYEFNLSYGLIPAKIIGVDNATIISDHELNLQRITRRPIRLDAQPHSPFITIFTSMFMHGGIGHLLFNMLFLWIFGDNVESGLGHRRFAIFFLLSAISDCDVITMGCFSFLSSRAVMSIISSWLTPILLPFMSNGL